MEKCYICEKGELENKKVPYELYGISIGIFPAEVCNKCNEVFFSEETSDKITEKVKKMGLWGLETKTKFSELGHSLAIRLNKRLSDFIKAKKGKEVTLSPIDENKILIKID